MKLKYIKILPTLIGLILQAAGFIIAVLAFNQDMGFPIPLETMLPLAAEINFIIGAVVFFLGTIFIVFSLESKAINAGKNPAVALLGFISPVGIIIASKFKKRPICESAEKGQPPGKKICLIGSIFTVIVTAVFIWGGYQWLQRNNFPPKLSPAQIQSNEILAFERLKQIREAQQKYILKDWDGDGQKNYAQFLAHLWQSVDSSADPVKVGLLPRKLAFAMRRPFAIDGYIYVDLHYSFTRPNKHNYAAVEINEIDPNTGFAISALPASNKETGVMSFIITQKGDVHARTLDHITYGSRLGLLPCPTNFTQEGWRQIHNIDDLKKFQKEVAYTK